MTPSEKKRFNKFKEEVMGYDMIDVNILTILVNRNVQGNTGRRFFNDTLKLKYYKFWIKMLQDMQIIIPKENAFGMWSVRK